MSWGAQRGAALLRKLERSEQRDAWERIHEDPLRAQYEEWDLDNTWVDASESNGELLVDAWARNNLLRETQERLFGRSE